MLRVGHRNAVPGESAEEEGLPELPNPLPCLILPSYKGDALCLSAVQAVVKREFPFPQKGIADGILREEEDPLLRSPLPFLLKDRMEALRSLPPPGGVERKHANLRRALPPRCFPGDPIGELLESSLQKLIHPKESIHQDIHAL